MIGLDTNVLVRYVAQDDAIQSAKATQLVEALTVQNPGFVSVVAVVELVWVLSSCYGSSKREICEVLETLLRTKELCVAQADTIWCALRIFRNGKADFADCLLERSANEAGCLHTATFDIGAAKSCGMQLID